MIRRTIQIDSWRLKFQDATICQSQDVHAIITNRLGSHQQEPSRRLGDYITTRNATRRKSSNFRLKSTTYICPRTLRESQWLSDTGLQQVSEIGGKTILYLLAPGKLHVKM
ncbi:Hypothetical_protein [Hexamita inflata]|uniref:Hypothetical_protein n=1 Tax=Hexamita inflata TaxID=28002 RepID=A0AA86TFX1_9EUKA|nr:Hypothetical protein HINF_LOCUS2732 [Hexamita inflata]